MHTRSSNPDQNHDSCGATKEESIEISSY